MRLESTDKEGTIGMAVHELRNGDRIARQPAIVGADTADEALLMNVESGFFYQLNSAAARIWNLAEQPLDFETLCGAMQARYAVSPEQCRQDVTEFLTGMEERGLIQITRG